MAILATYAQAWADVSRMEQDLRGKETINGPQGPVVNPLLKAIGIRKREMFTAAAKLGFSPVDRARVPKSQAAEADEFSGFIK
jgi:phage terminase small subunit